MAFPPPFPNQRMPPTRIPQIIPQPGGRPQGGAFQTFGFFSPQTPPTAPTFSTLPMVGGIPLVLRPPRQPRPRLPFRYPRPEPPPFVQSQPPLCTIFVGNITDKCHDSVIQEILGKCGTVNNWKRLQDSNGKFKSFGFCDFLYPDGAGRALQILKGFPLGDKRLNVKADEQTEKIIVEYIAKAKDEKNQKMAVANGGNEATNKTDPSEDEVKEAVRKIIEDQAPELLELTPIDEDEQAGGDSKSEAGVGGGRSPADGKKTPTKSKRRHSRSPSRSRSGRKRSTSKGKKRSRRRTSTGSSSSSSGSSLSSASSISGDEDGGRSSRKDKHGSKKTHRKRTPSSEDSDEVAEKRRLKKELRDREDSYLKRLKKWEEREKRMAKQYEKDAEAEKQRVKTIQKEAKKLRQFLEDYLDHRDDPKYYKGSALFERRRNYEKEREADAKDRREERKELDDMKKMIQKGERRDSRASSRQGGEVSDNTEKAAKWETVDEQRQMKDDNVAAMPSTVDGDTPRPVPTPSSSTPAATESSPSPLKQQSKIVTTLQQKTLSAPVNGLFEMDEDEEDTLHQIKKKIKPFEITREDRIHSLTPEERKKLIKELIGRIPTDSSMLFAFTISWEFLDEQLMEGRVRPWINKKICDYIGEEEPSLVSFICEKIGAQTSPENILQDLSMVLDDEAEVFMVKLWRLIVYESEAKRLGLNVLPSGKST